ncbi:RDD family protein [Salsuginibacillus kocurii]|uniref:RDD family protein n=1 Tax=Salsuginibacillus kocurii TaxID=427078 RepID=UPI000382DDF6|nr:RDD family protein [Salsuginibacillus kocurii]
MDMTIDERHTSSAASSEEQTPPPRDGEVVWQRSAGFWMRFWAYLLDLAIVASINGLLISPIFLFTEINLSLFGILSLQGILTSLTAYIYFVLMTKFTTQTLGKMVFGLRVATLTGEPLTWSDIMFREVVGRFIHRSLIITNVLYIVVAFHPKKQGIHDLFADTQVVHVE